MSKTDLLRQAAKLERPGLIDLLEREHDGRTTAENRASLAAVELHQERNKPVYLIAAAMHHAVMAADWAQIERRRRRFILTNSLEFDRKLRGLKIKSSDCLLVRGWTAGEWTYEVRRMLDISGAPTEAMAYAPDPHIDMLESGDYRTRVIEEYKREQASKSMMDLPGSTLQFAEGDYTVQDVSCTRSVLGEDTLSIGARKRSFDRLSL